MPIYSGYATCRSGVRRGFGAQLVRLEHGRFAGGCVASAAFWVSLKDLSYFQSGFVWGFFFIKYI